MITIYYVLPLLGLGESEKAAANNLHLPVIVSRSVVFPVQRLFHTLQLVRGACRTRSLEVGSKTKKTYSCNLLLSLGYSSLLGVDLILRG